ncbi:MAG: glycosyltransferase family 4 protein [Candidatus Omnitrophota bacterium]
MKNNNETEKMSDEMRFRGFMVWRKDLCHINKTCDDHCSRFGRYFDLTLLVTNHARIGDRISSEGTRVVVVQCPKNRVMALCIFYIKAAVFFMREHRKEPFHFILSPVGEEPVGFLFKLLSFPRTKLIFDLYDVPGASIIVKGSPLPKRIAWKIYRWVLAWSIRKGDVILAGVVIEGLRRFNIPEERLIDAEKGVPLEYFDPRKVEANEKIWSFAENKRLLYIGYIHEKRGAGDIIHAVRELVLKGVKVSLMLIGPCSKDTLNKLRSLVSSLELESYVSILAPVDSTEMPGVIAGSEICVCPVVDIEQYRWSYPLKVNEYLAMGKPVIATKLVGTSRIVKEGVNGLLYPSGDVEGLARCIETLATDEELYRRLAAAARDSVLDNDWEILVRNLAGKIKEHLSGRGSAC